MAEISVLIPVYNAEKYLIECLESVKNQTFENFEVLIIDDGSRDASGTICDEYATIDERFQVRHQENQGSGRTRNVAIDWAMEHETNYIVWVDSDDVVHPLYLEHLYQTIKAHSECDIVQCRYTSNKSELQQSDYKTKEVSHYFCNIDLLTEMMGGNYGCDFTLLWNKIYRKNLYEKSRVKLTDYFSGRMQDDVNILSQIYKISKGCFLIEDTLYYYRIVQNSIQHKKISEVNLEYIYIYRDLYLECKDTEFDSFADYLSERILFDIAGKLREEKNKYVDYKGFYKKLKSLYKLLDKQIDFVCDRKDIYLLNLVAKRWFYAFRLYAILYNYRGKVKALLKK